VVTSGESYDDAIRRELAEELGIEGAEPAFLIKSRYRDSEINWWTCCYEVMWDGPIVHREEEIAWGRFMPEDELIASLDEFPFVPDGLVVFRRYLDERARYRLHIQPDLRRNGCHGGHRLDGPTKLHADISVQAADAG
jgi:ADP-ribose pyrophosphatase YjhB (NUDIX family)